MRESTAFSSRSACGSRNNLNLIDNEVTLSHVRGERISQDRTIRISWFPVRLEYSLPLNPKQAHGHFHHKGGM